MKHYIKNLLIFVCILFDKKLFQLDVLYAEFKGFVSFCLMSSVVYIINDIRDVEADRRHEIKCKRPIASGDVNVKTAYLLAAVLLIFSVSVNIVSGFGLRAYILLGCYLFVNIGYSFGLKHIPILDVVLLVTGFLIRVLYGAAIVSSEVSSWAYLTVITLSFYLGLGKRRNELKKVSKGQTRKVLSFYTYEFLDKFMYLCLSLSIAFYAL